MACYSSFHTHSALALSLIALVAGCFLISKACAEDFFCKKTGKIVGGIVMILSILSIICIFYVSIQRCCYKNKDFKGKKWHHPHIERGIEYFADVGHPFRA